jgi:hypothetical protein
MNEIGKMLIALASVCLAIIISTLILTIPLMLCWNYVMPYLFGLKTLGLLQAFCLSVITSILIKPSSVKVK